MGRVSPKAVFEGITTAAMLLASITVMIYVWQNSSVRPPDDPENGPLPKAPVSLVGSALEGNLSAPKVLVVFSDFECPYCRSFGESVLPAFREQYVETGRILVSFRHLPLRIHQAARAAAEAAECAREQGQFWRLHDAFFGDPSTLRDIDTTMRAVGIDPAAFGSCKTSRRAAQVVDADLQLANALEIRATPTFLVGTNDGGQEATISTRFTGVADYESLVRQIGSVQDGPGR
jgi:protein-disulfide isomerase